MPGPEEATLQSAPQIEASAAVQQSELEHAAMSLDSLPIAPQQGDNQGVSFKDRFRDGAKAVMEAGAALAENPRVRRAALHLAVAAGRGAGLKLDVSQEGAVSLTGVDHQRLRQHGPGVKTVAKGVANDALNGARAAVPVAVEELRG